MRTIARHRVSRPSVAVGRRLIDALANPAARSAPIVGRSLNADWYTAARCGVVLVGSGRKNRDHGNVV